MSLAPGYPRTVRDADGEGRQNYNVTLAALTVACTAFALQQTLVIPALSFEISNASRAAGERIMA